LPDQSNPKFKESVASYSKGVLLIEAAGFSKATITEDGKQVEVF
jgi:hypothetical protein